MRLTLALLLLCGGCAPLHRAEPVGDAPSLAFTDVNVVDVESGRLLPAQTVLIAGNRIQNVGSTRSVRVPAGAQVVEAPGKYLIPGLWDMHVHAGSAEAFDAQIKRRSALLVAHGITGVRNHHSTAPLDEWVRIRKEIQGGSRVGPRLVLSGPMLDGPISLRPGAVTVRTTEEVRSAVDMLLRGGADYVNISPTLPREAYLALAEEANRRGVIFVGPVPPAIALEEASALGHGSIEHLSPIPESCSPRSSEFRAVLGEVYHVRARGEEVSGLLARRDLLQDLVLQTHSDSLCQALFRTFAANRTWIVPTLVVERANALAFDARLTERRALPYASPAERLQWDSLRSAAMQTTDAGERAHMRTIFSRRVGLIAAMRRAGVRLLAGTDIPGPFLVPGISLHEELELLHAAGLSPAEALQTATLNPARYLRATDSLGTVEAGRLADLVLLQANPLEDIRNTQKIEAVVLNGRYLDRRALDALLVEVARAAAQTNQN